MQTLVVVIILLSLLGVYINFSNNTELNRPELNKLQNVTEEEQNLTLDEIKDKIEEQMKIRLENDIMGNSTNTGDGLETDKKIVNLKVNSNNVQSVDNSGMKNFNKQAKNIYGLNQKSLSYENNFPYNQDYMSYTRAEDNIKSKIDIASKDPKGMGMRSQIILPQNESDFKENYSFNNRAIAIIRNQIANENKNYTYINEVNNDEIAKRGSLQVHRVMPTTLEIKDKPDAIDVYNTRSYEIIKDKYKTFNKNDKVNETTKLNLKI